MYKTNEYSRIKLFSKWMKSVYSLYLSNKRHGIGFRDRAKEKNIESETVVTDLICTVVLFSAVLGQHCGLHVCTTFSRVLTLIHDLFFYSYGQRRRRREKEKKRYRKYHLTQSVRRRYSYLN